MSLPRILEQLTNDQIIQLATESRNWSEDHPQYQVPFWHLFTKPDFHFEHLIQVPNLVSQLLTINWDDRLPEGPHQGASFAWYLVQLPYSEELFADHHTLRDRLSLTDWDNAPTAGSHAGYSLGWAILLKDVITMVQFRETFPKSPDHAIHRCDWNRKGPQEWADVTFAWMYEERWAPRTYSLMRYNRAKLMQCDWTTAPTTGPKQGLTLGWLLSRKIRSTDCTLPVLEKLKGCDWDYVPNEGKRVTIPWMLVTRLKQQRTKLKDWQIAILMGLNWDYVPDPYDRYQDYSRSIAWHLVDALFSECIQVPELVDKLLQSNWDGKTLSSSITFSLIQHPDRFLWLQTEPRAQAKFARCNWELIQAHPHENYLGKTLLLYMLDEDYSETREFLLTNGYLLERLIKYNMNESCRPVMTPPLGKELTKYYVTMKGYEFMAMLISKHPYILEVGLRNQEPIRQEEKLHQAFLEFAVLMDCYLQRNDQPLLKDLIKPLFDAHIAGYFPHLRHHSLIPFLLKKWEEWEKEHSRVHATALAMLVEYRKRQQEGVLWTRPRAQEPIRIANLAKILGKVPHSSRAAKEAVKRLGAVNAEFTPAAVVQEIQHPTAICPLIELKITISEILNKVLSKRYRWREVDKKSPRFFTPFHGTRAHTLAKALQAAETANEMQQILQNQLDIYENPKHRIALPAIQDTGVATRLAADFKHYPFKGIQGYYNMLNHLMKLVGHSSLRAVRSNPGDVSKNSDHNVAPQHQSWIASQGS